MSKDIVVWGIHNTNNESMLLNEKVIARLSTQACGTFAKIW